MILLGYGVKHIGKIFYEIFFDILADYHQFAVIDKHDPALRAYLPRGGKLVYFCKEHRRGYRQHRLLIVARHDYIQYGSHDSLLKM